jgi:hypothetical protein
MLMSDCDASHSGIYISDNSSEIRVKLQIILVSLLGVSEKQHLLFAGIQNRNTTMLYFKLVAICALLGLSLAQQQPCYNAYVPHR